MKTIFIIISFLISLNIYSSDINNIYLSVEAGGHTYEKEDMGQGYEDDINLYFSLGVYSHLGHFTQLPYLSDSLLLGITVSDMMVVLKETEYTQYERKNFWNIKLSTILFLDYMNAGILLKGEVNLKIIQIGIGYAVPSKKLGDSSTTLMLSYFSTKSTNGLLGSISIIF